MSSSVRHLDISHNNVTDLVGITSLIFQEIDSVFLAGNPFMCDCDSNTDWFSSFINLRDYDSVVCYGPAPMRGRKVVCFDEQCANASNPAYPFGRMCNESSRVDITSAAYMKAAKHIRTTIPDVCDLSQYTTPTTTTMSTRPVSTTLIGRDPGTGNSIQIAVSTEKSPKGDAVNVVWRVADKDRNLTRGYRITSRKQRSDKVTVLLMAYPELKRYSLKDLDPDENYEVCVEVLMKPGQTVEGGSDCAIFRTDPAALPLINGFSLIIIITVTAVVAVILFIAIIVCLCLRRQRRRSRAKKVGVKRGSSSLATSPQTWVAPDVTLVGNQNDHNSIHSDGPDGKKPAGIFDGSDIWLDANIVSDPFPDDLSQLSFNQLKRGNSELSVRPDSWYQQNEKALSRSASDVGKSSKWKTKQKNKKSSKSKTRDVTLARAGMWVDSFADPGDVRVEENEELGEQTTLSLNIFDGKTSLTNGGPPSVWE
jgi:hypothetical protein